MLVIDPSSGYAVNPRLVYALEVLKTPIVPRVYTASVTFSTAAAGDELDATLNERVPADSWIKSVELQILQPHMFSGNIYKPQRDSYMQQNTYFTIEVETTGAPPSECIKLTSDGPMPLEHYACGPGTPPDRFNMPFGEQFVLGEDMNIRHRIRSLQALTGDQVPTIINLTYKVRQLDGCRLRTVDLAQARAWMNSPERRQIKGV